ncbi:hypothetical protein ACIOD1_31415, partial [Streptomyces sp. NPDC088097]
TSSEPDPEGVRDVAASSEAGAGLTTPKAVVRSAFGVEVEFGFGASSDAGAGFTTPNAVVRSD